MRSFLAILIALATAVPAMAQSSHKGEGQADLSSESPELPKWGLQHFGERKVNRAEIRKLAEDLLGDLPTGQAGDSQDAAGASK